MAMVFFKNPFFWALVSMLGMVGATSLFNEHRLRHNRLFVAVVLTLVTVGRIVLVLPQCAQPRFEVLSWHLILGGFLLALALAVVAVPLFVVRWWAPPVSGMKLRTTGIYGVIRHPIYLAEVLWPLGLAIMLGSWIGVALTPVWWVAFLIHAISEEAGLEQAMGSEYADYKKKVSGRFLPGLPI